jgi:hypothetical protein
VAAVLEIDQALGRRLRRRLARLDARDHAPLFRRLDEAGAVDDLAADKGVAPQRLPLAPQDLDLDLVLAERCP